jgi:hypothetical protein
MALSLTRHHDTQQKGIVTLGINDTQHNNAVGIILLIVMKNVFSISIIMLSVFMLGIAAPGYG